MHITLILGSVRQNRESAKPAAFIEAKLKEAGHTVNFVDLLDLALPVFDDAPEQYLLPGAIRLSQAITEAEGIVLVFPEYNHDMGSGLRNAFSYLRKREFSHRPVGLAAVSNGQYGGVRALYAAKASLPTLGGIMLPTVVSVDTVQTAFPDATTCTNPKIKGAIAGMLKELAAYGPALTQVRAALA